MQLGGAWQDEQDAQMVLALEPDGFLHGDFRAAAGLRRLAGYAGRAEDGCGVPLALAMSWRPVEGGPATPEQHWASCFGGEAAGGRLALLHQISATAGLHLESRRFRRIGAALPESSGPVLAAQAGATLRRAAADPVEGTWRALEGASVLTLQLRDPHAGLVFGSLADREGEALLCGFADIDAGAAQQSVALAGRRTDGTAVLALAGRLDLERGLLTLGGLAIRGTGAGRPYGQTLIEGLRFQPA